MSKSNKIKVTDYTLTSKQVSAIKNKVDKVIKNEIEAIVFNACSSLIGSYVTDIVEKELASPKLRKEVRANVHKKVTSMAEKRVKIELSAYFD